MQVGVRRSLVASLFLFAGGSGSLSSADQESLVVPGKNVGPITIGMPLSEAKERMKVFGPVKPAPSYAEEFEERQGFCNPSRRGVCVYDDAVYLTDSGTTTNRKQSGLVMEISTDDTTFRTATGLGVGSPLGEFIPIFGAPRLAMPPKSVLDPRFRDTGIIFIDWPLVGVGGFARLAPPFPHADERVSKAYLSALRMASLTVSRPIGSARCC